MEQPGLVQQPPGQHPRRIVVDELAGEQKKEAGDDRDVEPGAGASACCLAQPSGRPARRGAAC
jgi:hypothetical protein